MTVWLRIPTEFCGKELRIDEFSITIVSEKISQRTTPTNDNIQDVFNPFDRRVNKEVEQREPWPQIGEYNLPGIPVPVRVYQPGFAEGVKIDHTVRSPRKK